MIEILAIGQGELVGGGVGAAAVIVCQSTFAFSKWAIKAIIAARNGRSGQATAAAGDQKLCRQHAERLATLETLHQAIKEDVGEVKKDVGEVKQKVDCIDRKMSSLLAMERERVSKGGPGS